MYINTYTVAVHYKGFMNTATTTVNSASGTTQTVATDVFIEFEPFGPMTFTTFLLWMIIIIVIAAIVIVIRQIRRHQGQATQELLPPPPP